MTDETTPVIAAAYPTPKGKDGGVYADVRSEDLSTTLVDRGLAALCVGFGQGAAIEFSR